MYQVVSIILKVDTSVLPLDTLLERLNKVTEVTSFSVGPKVYERTIDGKVFIRTEGEG